MLGRICEPRTRARASRRLARRRRQREAAWWANAFEAQCKDAARRAASSSRRGSSCRRARDAAIRDACSTGRSRWPRPHASSSTSQRTSELRAAVARAAERAVERIGELARARPALPRARRPRLRASSTTDRVTCSRSATTSATTASTPASTTCSPPRRGWPASSRSRRASCRRSTGSASAGCSPTSGGRPALLSWSGSMFEYLMPLLVMPTYDGTLLDETYRAVVDRQIAYGRERGVPWGVSESGYNTIDAQLNYQYRAFGVPGLGLQARPGRRPGRRAVRQRAGADGRRPRRRARTCSGSPRDGPARAVRLLRGDRLHAVAAAARAGRASRVRSFMAHHQGMSVAVARVPAARPADAAPLRRRSGVPGDRPAAPGARAQGAARSSRIRPKCRRARSAPAEAEATMRVFTDAEHAGARSAPAVQRPLPRRGHQRRRRLQPLARPGGHPLARRPDPRLLGHVLLPPRRRDRRRSGRPRISRRSSRPTSYEAIFSQGRAEFRRRDDDIDTHVEISVSPEDDIELRRISITNRGRSRAHDRADELRRSRARAAGGRRGASGVQQPVRADRARARRGRRSSARAGRAPAASGRRG